MSRDLIDVSPFRYYSIIMYIIANRTHYKLLRLAKKLTGVNEKSYVELVS
jgi:hypothetical protein